MKPQEIHPELAEEREELAMSLETLLHGYRRSAPLFYAFQIGINHEEAMRHYENARLLLTTLQTNNYGNIGNQAAA